MFRSATTAMLAASIVGVSVFASPANAQRASDCGQLTDSSNRFSYVDEPGRSDSATVLTGLINAAIQNLDVVANVPVNGNVSVVCVTDSLNGNHLEILKNINVDVIDDVTLTDIDVLNNVDVLAISGNKVYVAPIGLIGGPADS